MTQRFVYQDRQVYDRWRKEKLELLTFPNSPEILARLHGIYAFHSSLLQNIVDFTPGHFQIQVLAQPFVPSRPDSLSRLPAAQAAGALQQCLAFLDAARKWNMDFVDFSKFQVLPNGSLRFAWTTESLELPTPAALARLFRGRNSTADAGPPRGRRSTADAGPILHTAQPSFLCRREDFAANLLRSRSPRGLGSDANARIRIHTKSPWQKAVARDILFHNLMDERTLLLRADLRSRPLSRALSSLCGRQDMGKADAASLAQAFGLYLKKSVYQEALLLIEDLEAKADDRLLRFLLESGDVAGLTAVILGDSAPGDCDLEFNEDPPNLLASHLSSPFPESMAKLTPGEKSLLQRFAAVEVPIPADVAWRLASQGDATPVGMAAAQGDATPVGMAVPQGEGRNRPPSQGDGKVRIATLLAKRCLREEAHGTLRLAAPGCAEPAPPRLRDECLSWLARNTDWPYAQVAHLIAGGQMDALEQYLAGQARESPWHVAESPASDLICRHLENAPPRGGTREIFADLLIRGNRLALAERILAADPGPETVPIRLKRAHLAMRRKDYPELGRLLAAIPRAPERLRDEWLYLNFIHHEKTARGQKSEAYLNRIRDPYYRNLAIIQWSDRSIYSRDFAKARSLLSGALKFFLDHGWTREELEAQSQMAKLLRESGRFAEAESQYKTAYVRSETEDLALNAASAAVDLGNLYLESDDDFQAECWYQKALKSFSQAKNRDGVMLVNSNRVALLVARGNWQEAERLLRGILAWDEEKGLVNSGAIDTLNWAGLEALRLNNDRARELADRAAAVFQDTSNRKGLAECAFLRGRLSAFADPAPAARPECRWLSEDQQNVGRLVAGPGAESRFPAALAAVQSKRMRFEALRLLLTKYRNRGWLEPFRQLAWELSAREKNYFYYEYWYMLFELADGEVSGAQRDEFLAMHDFFTANKRAVSAKLDRMRQRMEESDRGREFYSSARLVDKSRLWRCPEDFFNSFHGELCRPTPVDWLLMAIHEKGRPLFRFANSDRFRELGEEMLRSALESPENRNLGLAEVRGRFRSPERIFFPFACIKMIRWAISDDIVAGLVVGFQDEELAFQDFFERHRETFKKFSVLFLNFLQNEYRVREKLDFIVGESQGMQELKRAIAQVSKVDFSLLISGESGSGKELVARAVHALSPRAGRPFIPVNAAAIPDTLLEAELFGYRKGAFSGASEGRTGLLEAADTGTLFLDEIADLPLPLQAKLLRALQEREIRRLGENKTVPIDVRLVSATNKDLEELIRAGHFRADLFYRLQDLVIRIPPLRERREDIPPLIGHFLGKFGYPAQEPATLRAIAAAFAREPFAGNVRELESKVKKLITFHPGLEVPAAAERKPSGLREARAEFERNQVRVALNENSWHMGRTAAGLGISRMALFNLIRKHQIEK